MESLARSIVSRKRRIAATVRDCGPEVAGGSRVEVHTELTTNIVAAYVRRNQIGADQLPILISTVHHALASLGKPVAQFDRERTPAVPIRRSIHRDYVVCLECGWRGNACRKDLRQWPLSWVRFKFPFGRLECFKKRDQRCFLVLG